MHLTHQVSWECRKCDNSTHQQIWAAEITDGEFLEMKTDRMPAWFKTAVWDKFSEI